MNVYKILTVIVLSTFLLYCKASEEMIKSENTVEENKSIDNPNNEKIKKYKLQKEQSVEKNTSNDKQSVGEKTQLKEEPKLEE